MDYDLLLHSRYYTASRIIIVIPLDETAMANSIRILSVFTLSVLFALTGCSPPQTEGPVTAAESSATETPNDEQGLTDSQISGILAENRRVLGAMPDANENSEWKTIATVRCPANEEIDQTFTADSTWRVRWLSGGNCVVRTTPIDAYNDWYAFGGLSESKTATDPNKNPGQHSLNVSLCFDDCTLVIEQVAK